MKSRKTIQSLLTLAMLTIVNAACSFDDRYFDPTTVHSYQLSTAVIPASRVQEVQFNSNNEMLYGFFITSASIASGAVSKAPTLLYSHGNSDNIEEYWQRIETLDPLNYNIFIYDYQGYGKSSGSPSLAALYQNAIDALNYASNRSETDTQRLIFYGYSLGGIMAIHLAATVSTPWALITEATPASSGALVKNGVQLGIPATFFLDETFDSVAKIKTVSCPTLLFHGTADEEVPLQFNAEELANAAPDPKTLIIVEGAKHEAIIETLGAQQYRNLIGTFVSNHGN